MVFVSNLKKNLYLTIANYFRFWANKSLKRWHPRIIVITGSAGKTTMLNLVESQLGDRAHYSHNANSAYGIAFDVLGMHGITGSKLKWIPLILASPFRSLKAQHDEEFYIVEADAERPHDAEWVAKWLKPEASIWVTLGRSHAVFYEGVVAKGQFKNVDEAIRHEFAMIPAYTQKLVIVDGDDSEMCAAVNNIDAKLVKSSKKSLKSYEVYPQKAVFDFGKTKFTFNDPMPREVATQLAMLKDLMEYLELPLKSDLKDYQMPPARCNYHAGYKGINIIDSSYNAHIISMSSILDMMTAMKAEHKWLVIGDIIDQGKLEGVEHRKLADLLLAVKAEKIVMVGRRTKKYTYPLIKNKVDCVSFDKPQQALAYLQEELSGKETVMFKGSQYLEWVVEKLLAHPEEVNQLARQDEAHKRRRASWGLN